MEPLNSVAWNSATGEYTLQPKHLVVGAPQRAPIYVNSPFSGIHLPNIEILGSFYSNSNHTEAQVITARVEKSDPFGYLMRATTAFSKEAGYSDKKWFQKAALLTGYWALQFIDINQLPDNQNQFDAEELFSDSTSVLILDRTIALNYKIEQTKQLDAQLFSLGFIRIKLPNAWKWTPGKYASQRLCSTLEKNLNFFVVPHQSTHQNFLDEVFTNFIPQASLPLVRFFYFYQIIELLIEEIADASINASLARLAEHKSNHNSSLFRKEALQLQSTFKEGVRLNTLFSLSQSFPQEFSILKEACNRSLMSIGASPGDNVSALLYDIRNQIFHNYRFSGASLEQSLPEINELLEVIIPDLLIAVLAQRKHIVVPQIEHVTLVDVAMSELRFHWLP